MGLYLGENQFFFSEPSEIENSNKSLLKWKLGKSFVENWKGFFLLHAQCFEKSWRDGH